MSSPDASSPDAVVFELPRSFELLSADECASEALAP
jgi:hypothetical protein